MKPIFSILLCSYNREEKLSRCLDSISRQEFPAEDFEVVCVNDGSSDSTRDIMSDYLKDHRGAYVEHEQNRALAAARNSAIRVSRGQYLVFINDDTYPEPNFLQEHLLAQSRRKSESPAVLGYIPFHPQYSHCLLSRVLMKHNLYFPFTGMRACGEYPFSYFITGNLSVERSVFITHDVLFDETFSRYGYEDIECGYRLWKLGYRVFYWPQAVVQHDHLVTISEYRRRAVDNAVNILEVARKHRELRRSLLGADPVNRETIDAWKREVQAHGGVIEEHISHLAELESKDMRSLDLSSEQEEALIAECARWMGLLRTLCEYRTFYQTLEAKSELLEALSEVC